VEPRGIARRCCALLATGCFACGRSIVGFAAAIRTVFDQRGELSAAIELRRLFPGINDTAEAGELAQTIAGWRPLLVAPRPVR
jgi:hypothetical protein